MDKTTNMNDSIQSIIKSMSFQPQPTQLQQEQQQPCDLVVPRRQALWTTTRSVVAGMATSHVLMMASTFVNNDNDDHHNDDDDNNKLDVLSLPSPAMAKGLPIFTSRQEALDAIDFELTNPFGSIAQLEQAIEEQNFTILLELTKTMDQTLRKKILSNAKTFVTITTTTTNTNTPQQICNNVTFDLIGMNKFSRPGKENIQQVNQYLNELKNDLQQMKELLLLQQE